MSSISSSANSFFPANLKVSGEFNEFLAYLLVDIIDDRNNDIDAKEKLEATAIGDSIHKCNIKIDSHFYPLIESQEKMLNSKFISTGYQEF